MKLHLISVFIRHKINDLRRRWSFRVFGLLWLIGILYIPFLFQGTEHYRGLSANILFFNVLQGLFLFFIVCYFRIKRDANTLVPFRMYQVNDVYSFAC